MDSRSTAQLYAVRAIGAEFARRSWNITSIVLAVVGIFLVLLSGWLVNMSGWWWWLVVPLIIAGCVVAGVLGVFRLLIRHVDPVSTREQGRRVRLFVDRIEKLQAFAGTPKIVMLFRLVRSIAAPSSDTYLRQILHTKHLRGEFEQIAELFVVTTP